MTSPETQYVQTKLLPEMMAFSPPIEVSQLSNLILSRSLNVNTYLEFQQFPFAAPSLVYPSIRDVETSVIRNYSR